MSKIFSSLVFAHLRESILRFQNLIVQCPPIPLSVLGDDGINQCLSYCQGGRSWQPFGEGKNSHTNFRQARIYYFASNAPFLRVIANFLILLRISCNVYHVIVHLLSKNTILDPKKHFFCPKISQKCVATNLNIATKQRMLGLKILVDREESSCES